MGLLYKSVFKARPCLFRSPFLDPKAQLRVLAVNKSISKMGEEADGLLIKYFPINLLGYDLILKHCNLKTMNLYSFNYPKIRK